MLKSTLAALLLFSLITFAKAEGDLATRLQAASVTLKMGSAQCSGVVVEREGQTFILTAAHCLQGLRSVDTIIDDAGKPVVVPKFELVQVIKDTYVNSERVGKIEVEAEVLVYSSAEPNHDLALLRARAPFPAAPLLFADQTPVPVGTELLHVGSLGGEDGSNSFTTGILSQTGRKLHDKVYDQTSCTAMPGSSGGGIFRKSDGAYIGMLTRGSGETFNLFVPNRRIAVWAKIHRVEFLFNPQAPMDLSKVLLEHGEPTDTAEEMRAIDEPNAALRIKRK